MISTRLGSLLLTLCLALPTSVSAENAPTTSPTTPTTQHAPMVETAPPGFVRVSAGHYSAFCVPADQTWVQQALSDIKPALMPTTRPSDILANIAKNRDALVKGLADELGADPVKLAAMLDEKLKTQLDKLNTFNPPVVFLVSTEQKIISLINNNWKHPRISYNRLMGQIRVDDRMNLSIDQPMDEMLLVATYEPADDVAARAKKVHEAVEKFESETAFSVAARSRVVSQVAIAMFIESEVFAPLKFRDDQSWLMLGVTTHMAAKYTPMLTGADPKQMLADMIFERPDADPKADSIDMMKLPPLDQVQPYFRQAFINAARRKATLAIEKLVAKGGEDSIRKALNAVKKNTPKDGQSMVSLVAGATDVDLTAELGKK